MQVWAVSLHAWALKRLVVQHPRCSVLMSTERINICQLRVCYHAVLRALTAGFLVFPLICLIEINHHIPQVPHGDIVFPRLPPRHLHQHHCRPHPGPLQNPRCPCQASALFCSLKTGVATCGLGTLDTEKFSHIACASSFSNEHPGPRIGIYTPPQPHRLARVSARLGPYSRHQGQMAVRDKRAPGLPVFHSLWRPGKSFCLEQLVIIFVRKSLTASDG